MGPEGRNEKRAKKKKIDKHLARGKACSIGLTLRLFGVFLVCMCVADLKDGDVPAETLQRSSYLATFQPLLRRQSLQLLMKLHG